MFSKNDGKVASADSLASAVHSGDFPYLFSLEFFMSVRSSVSSKAFQRFLFLFVAIVLSSTTGSRAQSQSTNIEVSSAVQQSSVSRIGVTLSGVELEDAFERQSKSRGLNPAIFREELVGALKELHPGTIRMEFPDLSQQLEIGRAHV